MANAAFRGTPEVSTLPKRILANLKAQVSWDETGGNRITVIGITEYIGESGCLVNVEVLPSVGSNVKLRLYDKDKMIIEAQMTVIRVERDPARPLAALAVIKNHARWKEDAVTAAQAWLTKKLKSGYGDDWSN